MIILFNACAWQHTNNNDVPHGKPNNYYMMVKWSLSHSFSLALFSCKDSKIICTKNNNIKFNKIKIKSAV